MGSRTSAGIFIFILLSSIFSALLLVPGPLDEVKASEEEHPLFIEILPGERKWSTEYFVNLRMRLDIPFEDSRNYTYQCAFTSNGSFPELLPWRNITSREQNGSCTDLKVSVMLEEGSSNLIRFKVVDSEGGYLMEETFPSKEEGPQSNTFLKPLSHGLHHEDSSVRPPRSGQGNPGEVYR
ncbi:MAG: hypothetical protein ACMUIE_01670 [Thermoplasmatota archaeon]